MSKYHSQKAIVNGIAFDSLKEARRYSVLLLLQKAGEISDLQMQVPFELLPPQYEESTEVYKSGKNKGKQKPKKLLERGVNYIADFVYVRDGKIVVEDTKGYKQGQAYALFVVKRKLMLYKYGIKVQEV